MLIHIRFFLVILALLIAVLACAIPSIPPQDTNVANTAAVAQTVLAGLTQTAISENNLLPSPEPSLTVTPQTQTFTPTQTLTATLVFTPTRTLPQISVSVPTNCRSGPGKVYKLEGALLVGDLAQIFGRDPTGQYWYIHNPDSVVNYCWVWGEYATILGDIAFLPIYTPPPTPTPTQTPIPTFTVTPSPGFELTYSGLDSCSGWWVDIQLKNTGTIIFRSIGVIVEDTVMDVVKANFSDDFTDNDGCISSTSRDSLKPGKKFVVSGPTFNYDLTGNKLHITVILCSNIGHNGTCLTKRIDIKP